MITPGARLREIMQDDMIVAPGCYDGITSKLIVSAVAKLPLSPSPSSLTNSMPSWERLAG